MANEGTYKYSPDISKEWQRDDFLNACTQTTDDQFIPSDGYGSEFSHPSRQTPNSIETAVSARQEQLNGRSFSNDCCLHITSCCFTMTGKCMLFISWPCRWIFRLCYKGLSSMEASKSRLLALVLLLIEISLCIVFIINWHTKTSGGIDITEFDVQRLMVVYMAIGDSLLSKYLALVFFSCSLGHRMSSRIVLNYTFKKRQCTE